MPSEKHEHHHWLILGLLICVLALIGLIGFFGWQIFYGDRIQTIKRVEVDDSFFDEVLDSNRQAIEENLGPLEIPVTQVEEESFLTFKSSAFSPGFQYPKDWHVFSSTQLDSRPGYVQTIILDEQPIQLVEGETVFAVQIHTINRASADLEGAESYLAYHDLKHPDGEFYQESYRATSQVDGGTLTEIHASESGFIATDVEYLIYEGPGYSVVVTFTDAADDEEDNATWEAIKSSLDFSSIQ